MLKNQFLLVFLLQQIPLFFFRNLNSRLNLTLYQSGTKKVLFDAGAGVDFLSGMGTLVESLEAIDLSTDDITDVVFTHAHPDHIWGVLDDFDDLTFQNANYHIGRMEWEYWFDTETINKVREDRIPMAVGAKRRLEALEENINLFDSNDEIIDGIKALLTPGHSPGHMSFEIANGSRSALIVGDAINDHHVAFKRPNWLNGLDQNPDEAAQTRQKLLNRISNEDMLIIGFHLPFLGLGFSHYDVQFLHLGKYGGG